ncbi:DEAD/DEAH box helicase [Haloferax larsenii]|uniref:AAA domain-containing protein n=1 Tax=Haloferax larsenii TaxID=302484 RepID=A0A1H7TUX9_HALLR|nr:AAA domain-containing protein [Haloferax larsenii]SEL88365.1 AAA domain-containing protein [Haloferax larsenii]
MIENIFQDWRYKDATLLRTSTKAKSQSVNVSKAAQQAKDLLGIKSPDGKAYIIPLFKTDGPTPTSEYVLYKPQTDQIGWYDTGFGISGTERFAPCHKLKRTVIGQRLRFWLPSHRTEPELEIDESKLPPERVRPRDQLSASEQNDFFTQLKQFVRSERDTERESNWEQYEELGLEAAIQRNRVAGPFGQIGKVSTSDGESGYRFQILLDEEDEDEDIDLRRDEGIFQGNRCIVDARTNKDHLPIEVEILSVSGPQVVIRPVWSRNVSKTVIKRILSHDSAEIWLHELLNPVPYERRIDAIKQVESDNKKAKLLTGRRPVRFAVNKFAAPDSDIELNDYQRLALIWADSAQDIACIHGPPGTGKTRTLTAYVKHAVSRGQSVLVTAHSNQAVDNLLVGDSTPRTPEEDTLHALAIDSDTDLSIARVGNNSRNRVVQSDYVGKPASSADVVAATTSGASKFDRNEFDVAVVDEATQASRPATTIALNCAKKLVLAGDHKQLPPYCADETMQEEEMHISLFEYLLDRYDDEVSVLLRKQYRMNEQIAAFPNESFYEGDLETAERNRDWNVDGLTPIMGVDISGGERRQTHGNSFYNRKEAEAVAKQVKLLVQSGLKPEDIGVITAYTGQIGTIGRLINQLDVENSERVVVDTVDSFQGSEREAMIVSFVRSNPKGHSGFLEFPDEGPRRLNVALTRARKRLVLVGDWDTLGTVAPHRSPDESCAHHYANLAELLRSQEKMLSPVDKVNSSAD